MIKGYSAASSAGSERASLDLGRLGLDQLDDMLDHVGVLDMMVGHARQIDHVLAVAAAGDADVGLARFAGAVDDAAEHRERHRRADMLQPLLERLDGADHVEALPRAARAGDDADAAVADAERLQDLEADADFFLGLGRERDADRVADPGPQQAGRCRSTT